MVSAVFLYLIFYLLGILFLTYFLPVGIVASRRTGKAKHRTGTSREVAEMPRTEEAPTSTEHGKPQAHGSGKASDGREWGEVKTIRAKKPPIEALYPELPARRPNKG